MEYTYNNKANEHIDWSLFLANQKHGVIIIFDMKSNSEKNFDS